MKREAQTSSVRLLAGALIIGLSLFGTGCSASKPATTMAEKIIPVEVLPAGKKSLVETTAFSGKIVSESEVTIVPKISGKTVTAVNVKVGDMVRAGSVLYTMDPTDLQKTVELATINLRTAEANHQRTSDLFKAGMTSKLAMEQAQTLLDQAKVTQSQAQDNLNNLTVVATVSGSVAAVNVKAGDMAGPASTVIISNLDALNVSINVPENIVNLLKVGQEAKVDVTSAEVKETSGKVLTIAPSSDSKTQLYNVKIGFANKGGIIKPGMFARVDIPTRSKADVLAVKGESVVLKNGQNTVFVVEEDRAVGKVVTTGLDAGSDVEILKGINPGDKVIIKGQTLVEQGSKVKVVGGSGT